MTARYCIIFVFLVGFLFCLLQYGSHIGSGSWNGMLGEVMDGTADFCIADISITSERARDFAFSMPWMNLGISILYVKPRAAPPSLLAFLDPFTNDVRTRLLPPTN